MKSLADDLGWWQSFWAENDRCLYGDVPAAGIDALPVRPAFTTDRPRLPILVELGEDWIVDKIGVFYRRFIQDFAFQQETRDACAERLEAEIGYHLKPKVNSSALLHGSIYGLPINYPEDSTPWLEHIISCPQDVKALIGRMERADLAQAGLVPWFVESYRRLNRPYRWRILHDPISVHGPGTILGFLFGINDAMLYLADEPDLMQALLRTVARVTVDYSRIVRLLTGAPMTGVGVFEDVAGLVSPVYFREFFLPVYERIFGELAPDPTTTVSTTTTPGWVTCWIFWPAWALTASTLTPRPIRR